MCLGVLDCSYLCVSEIQFISFEVSSVDSIHSIHPLHHPNSELAQQIYLPTNWARLDVTDLMNYFTYRIQLI